MLFLFITIFVVSATTMTKVVLPLLILIPPHLDRKCLNNDDDDKIDSKNQSCIHFPSGWVYQKYGRIPGPSPDIEFIENLTSCSCKECGKIVTMNKTTELGYWDWDEGSNPDEGSQINVRLCLSPCLDNYIKKNCKPCPNLICKFQRYICYISEHCYKLMSSLMYTA